MPKRTLSGASADWRLRWRASLATGRLQTVPARVFWCQAILFSWRRAIRFRPTVDCSKRLD